MHNGRSNAEVPGKWISTENTGGEKLDLSWLDLMLIYIYLYNHMLCECVHRKTQRGLHDVAVPHAQVKKPRGHESRGLSVGLGL